PYTTRFRSLLAAGLGVVMAFVQIAAALGRETRAKETANQQKDEADRLRGEAVGREKEVRGTLAKLEKQFSAVARSYGEISDLEFHRGNVQDSLNWMLRAYEVAPPNDPL